jgi:hypothetical protein
LVSNTLSKPHAPQRGVHLEGHGVPAGRPKHSPMAARGLGAVWMTTCLVGSSMAPRPRRSVVGAQQGAGRAAVDALAAVDADHLAQRLVQEGGDLRRVAAADASSTPTSCRSMQVRTQRRQRMHLFMSRTTE